MQRLRVQMRVIMHKERDASSRNFTRNIMLFWLSSDDDQSTEHCDDRRADYSRVRRIVFAFPSEAHGGKRCIVETSRINSSRFNIISGEIDKPIDKDNSNNSNNRRREFPKRRYLFRTYICSSFPTSIASSSAQETADRMIKSILNLVLKRNGKRNLNGIWIMCISKWNWVIFSGKIIIWNNQFT